MEPMEIDMRPTYYRKSQLPPGLLTPCTGKEIVLPEAVQGVIQDIKNDRYKHKLILLHGLKRGKTWSAAAIMRAWIEKQKSMVYSKTPALFVPVRQLCYQNRTVDRYRRDEGLNELIRQAMEADILVLDGVFSYITQNDDLLLQALYDGRQYSLKTTIVTTSIANPLDCAGSVMFRVARDAEMRVEFC